MRAPFIVACLLLQACAGAPGADDSQVTTAANGSPGEQSCLPSVESVLEPAVSARLGVGSIIEIEKMNEEEDWIFVCGRPLNPDGSPVDYSRTLLKEQQAQGMLDDYFCSLLLCTEDGLALKELAVGDTDAPFLDWLDAYRVPESILYDE